MMPERASILASLGMGHLVVALFVFLLPTVAWPHPGGLDAYGCHHDRKAGGYHCHKGPLAGQSFASKAEMLEWLGGAAEAPAPTAAARADTYGSVEARFIRCYDGDTCTFDIPGWPPIVGQAISVRLRGVDAPEIRGQCEAERVKARAARDFVVGLLRKAERVELREIERGKYFRLIASIHADGVDIARALLEAGLAGPYEGGRREGWCCAGRDILVIAERIRRGYAQVMTIPPNVRSSPRWEQTWAMAINERQWQGRVLTIIHDLIHEHPEWRFSKVEQEVEVRVGGALRRYTDPLIYNGDGYPVCLLELKLPDRPDGRSPRYRPVVERTFEKALHLGSIRTANPLFFRPPADSNLTTVPQVLEPQSHKKLRPCPQHVESVPPKSGGRLRPTGSRT